MYFKFELQGFCKYILKGFCLYFYNSDYSWFEIIWKNRKIISCNLIVKAKSVILGLEWAVILHWIEKTKFLYYRNIIIHHGLTVIPPARCPSTEPWVSNRCWHIHNLPHSSNYVNWGWRNGSWHDARWRHVRRSLTLWSGV